uniref:Frizzled-4 n=1 Tax=Rhabditophanes sp. KR3021 TaxID=114890 RepID=A0AC35TRP4_9BILA
MFCYTEENEFRDDYSSADNNKCVPIRIKMCSDIAYNMTMFPNLLQHQKQEEAEIEINQFMPLVKIGCSNDLKLFLCTVYAPFCNVLPTPLPPCKHLCLSAKNGCENLLLQYGFQWPVALDCNSFPSEGLCVGENRTSSSHQYNQKHTFDKTRKQNTLDKAFPDFVRTECPKTMISRSPLQYTLKIGNRSVDQCGMLCDVDHIFPMFFDKNTRNYLKLWASIWAIFSFVCAMFTVFTFLIDLPRFKYPARPILYLSFCCMGISSVYLIPIFSKEASSCSAISSTGAPLITQGLDNFWCSIMAVTQYYFQIAAVIWWLILTYCWYLTSRAKWTTEFITGLAKYFHLIAWGCPCLLVIILLSTQETAIDGDMFSDVCSMGNLNPDVLFKFVFMPLSVVLGVGVCLLVLDILSMKAIKNDLKSKTHKLNNPASIVEKEMFRISLFSFLIVIPFILYLASILYQSVYFDRWLTEWYTLRCNHGNRLTFGFVTSKHNCPPSIDVMPPKAIVFYIKYLCQLVTGVTCAIWVFSGKTIGSYANAYSRLIHGESNALLP